ncbi:MAG: adenosylcobinamide amidohydrolase [Desulfobacterales bacterium]|nr:adenosylcobinamide amidohydrolase [Desulfobacterales bacterium]
MNTTRIFRTTKLLSLTCLLFLLCPAFSQAVVVRDATGNALEFSLPPSRVVSIVPSATEILFELGAGNAVTGLTYHDATLKGAEGKTVVGGFFQPAVEKLKAVKPDLVILGRLHKEIAADLKACGIPVFVYDTINITQAFETILTLGDLFGKREEARKIIARNRDELDLIQRKLAKAVPGEKKRVMRLMGRNNVMTPGRDSFQNELIRLAGGIPPDFGRKGPVIEVSKEEWLAFNPQAVYGCGGDRNAARELFSRPGWKDVDAVKNRQIFYFPCELTCRAATNTGRFVQWLSSMVYTDEFSDPGNEVLETRVRATRLLDVDLPYVEAARINHTSIRDFDNKTLMVDFKRPQTIISTLEGFRTGITSVGNHYSPPPAWGIGHKLGIDNIRARVLEANMKKAPATSFLITGADMGNLSIKKAAYKDMEVTALVTAGVMSNALRMSKDVGGFYEPGTINILIMSNMELSDRAMTRAVIAATEGKTAALEDMDIRSTARPLVYEATGTGTDNVLVVKGEGLKIKNSGGHTKMGELISKAVYAGVNEAVLMQNKVTAQRHVFQRLKERRISVFSLVSDLSCDCLNVKEIKAGRLARKVEHLLLEKEYAGFIEGAMALSDEYEKGLVKDLSLFNAWCGTVAGGIAGRRDLEIRDYLSHRRDIPLLLRTGLNTLITGAVKSLEEEGHE